MKPDSVLVKEVRGQVIILSGRGCNTINLVGSSIPAMTGKRDRYGMTSVTFEIPSQTTKGVIAMVVVVGKSSKKTMDAQFLLRIEKVGDEYKVDMEKVFVPNQDRSGQMDSHLYHDHGARFSNGINVKIEGAIYTSLEEIPDTFYVPDPDLLCKFMVGDVDAEAVKKAAQECEAEATAREKLAAMDKKTAALAQRLEKSERLQDQVIETSQLLQRQTMEINRMTKEKNRNWRIGARLLREAVTGPWWTWLNKIKKRKIALAILSTAE